MKREIFFKFAVFATIILFSLTACEKEIDFWRYQGICGS